MKPASWVDLNFLFAYMASTISTSIDVDTRVARGFLIWCADTNRRRTSCQSIWLSAGLKKGHTLMVVWQLQGLVCSSCWPWEWRWVACQCSRLQWKVRTMQYLRNVRTRRPVHVRNSHNPWIPLKPSPLTLTSPTITNIQLLLCQTLAKLIFLNLRQ